MIRVLWFALKLAVLVAIAYWLAERPGRVSMDWLGYRVETSVGILLLAVFVLVIAAALAYRFWRFLYRAPRGVGQSLQAGRRKRGYKALTQGMVAVAAGEADEAARHARRADSLLDEPPLTMLLSAQAAQLNGDEAAAKRYFTAMLDDPETRFLGLRGLLTQALREGDQDRALDYVRQAHAMRPRTPWVLNSLFDLSERRGDLATAERALGDAARAKALPAPESARKRAVVLMERARAAGRDGDPAAALVHARAAHKLAPGLVPATGLLAELLLAAGKGRAAAKTIERAWATAPHPDLAALYLATQTGADPLARVKHVGILTAKRPLHPESHLARARAALDARLWGEARRHIKAAAGEAGLDGGLEAGPGGGSGGGPSERVCRLMAELAERENGDEAAARAWLTRAATAPKDPAWVCTSCGAVSPEWRPRCGACDSFDTLAWQPPPRVEPRVEPRVTNQAASALIAPETVAEVDGAGGADRADGTDRAGGAAKPAPAPTA